jgi:hypothetical protein
MVTQRNVALIVGESRLKRLLAAGWLQPSVRSHSRVLYCPRDIHRALARMEKEACPANKAEVTRVRDSELRNGHPRVRRVDHPQPRASLDDLVLDFTGVRFNNVE